MRSNSRSAPFRTVWSGIARAHTCVSPRVLLIAREAKSPRHSPPVHADRFPSASAGVGRWDVTTWQRDALLWQRPLARSPAFCARDSPLCFQGGRAQVRSEEPGERGQYVSLYITDSDLLSGPRHPSDDPPADGRWRVRLPHRPGCRPVMVETVVVEEMVLVSSISRPVAHYMLR